MLIYSVAMCTFFYTTALCYEKPSDSDRVGMTNYLAQKYGKSKKKRKYTKHKRYFKNDKRDTWDNSYD